VPTVFILHGIYGNPDENWFPCLKHQLETKGCTVHVPHLPTHEPLLPEHWLEAFFEYESLIDHQSIIIGHSLGVAFGLKVIEKHPVAAAFLVAPAWGITENEFDPIMGAVANQTFNWEIIKKHCPSFTIFHADNDPYLQVERAETLAKNLDTDFILVSGAGHFNEAAGYREFPDLLAKIEEVT
jgi:uncharacterized protein